MQETPNRGDLSVNINLRAPRLKRDLIDRAAAATGKTRTEFMLDAASRAAEEALLDRCLFVLDTPAYDAFVARLEASPGSSPGLATLLGTKAPWAD